MNKKERFQAVREKRAPDYMPVWPRVMSQMLYSYGYSIPEVTGQDWYDSEKVTQAVLTNIKEMDYDVAIPTYVDYGFGVPSLGGTGATAVTVPAQPSVGRTPTPGLDEPSLVQPTPIIVQIDGDTVARATIDRLEDGRASVPRESIR